MYVYIYINIYIYIYILVFPIGIPYKAFDAKVLQGNGIFK